jgi:hypothetical protein
MRGIALALIAATLVAGCATAPPEAQSNRDPAANFAAYSTFGWGPAPDVSGAEPPLRLLDQNIRAAIVEEMRRRGYVETTTGEPDLRIVYETKSAEKVESNPVRVGVGVGSWGGNVGGSVNVGSPSLRHYREGTLVIHAIDTKRNAEVWEGRISGRISKGSTDAAAVSTAVRAAMKDFPVRGR